MKKDVKFRCSNNVQIAGIIVLGIVIVALFVFLALKSFAPFTGETIDVQGFSEVRTSPDIIGIYYSIETYGDTQAEVTESNTGIVNSLTAYLDELDLDDLTTESFNVRENYGWDDGNREINGYVATHILRLELSKVEKKRIGEAVDAGVSVGANINRISFELSQSLENKLKAEAMELAAEDARIKAEAVAKGFGKRLGKLVSVEVSDWGYYPWKAYDVSQSGEGFVVAEAKKSMEISPGMKTISATVRARFEFK